MQKELIKLAVDLANNRVQNYENRTPEEANNTLRNAFLDLMEISDGGKIDRKTFRRHKTEIFEILEVILEETINEGLENQFDHFAEYRNLKWGDTNKFVTPDNQVFRIAMVSDGNSNIRRQRLRDGEEFMVSLDTYSVKIYEDFHRFLAGRINWAEMVSKIAESFKRDLTQKVYDAVYQSHGEYETTYHTTISLSTGADAMEQELIEMAMHLQARTGEKVNIYGTKLALRNFAPSKVTEAMNDARNKTGFYGEIAGLELREIQQSHNYGSDTFAIANDFVMLLPDTPDKFVKIVNEGEAIIQETVENSTADMVAEYFIAQRFGIVVITSMAYGFIKLTE